MGFSEAESQCRRHQDHKQEQGVCAFCLREKLSQLNVVNNKRRVTLVIPSGSRSASSSTSRCDSPVNCRGHHRAVSEVLSSMSLKLSLGTNHNCNTNKHELKKSKSIAFVPRNLGHVTEGKNFSNGKKKKINSSNKKGFWSKLLPLKCQKREVFMQQHPRTVSLRLF